MHPTANLPLCFIGQIYFCQTSKQLLAGGWGWDRITLTGFMETYLPEDEKDPRPPWNTWLPDRKSRLKEDVCWGGNQECLPPKGNYLENALIKISFVSGSDLAIVSLLHFLYVLILSDLKWNHILQVRSTIPLEQGSLDQNFPLWYFKLLEPSGLLPQGAVVAFPPSASSPPSCPSSSLFPSSFFFLQHFKTI